VSVASHVGRISVQSHAADFKGKQNLNFMWGRIAMDPLGCVRGSKRQNLTLKTERGGGFLQR